MIKLFRCAALLIGFSAFQLQGEPLKLKVNAESAILMNAETGQILYEKNAHALYYPASITKVATAAYALKKKGDSLHQIVIADQDSIASIGPGAKKRANFTQPAHWIEHGSSHIGIKKGEELEFQDLLYGMMLTSANDAANLIAQFAGGTIPNFMNEMNGYLKEIGCRNTTFYNPHGLHHPKHQTTAYDMAILTKEALKDPKFCEIVSTVRYNRPKTNKQESATLVQTNRLLRSGRYYYSKAIGVKTGHTAAAQNTFIAAARQGDRTLIAVLLKVKERNDIFIDSSKMFEAAFNEQKVSRTLLKSGEQKFALELKGAKSPVKTYLKDDVKIEYYPAEEQKVKCLLYWEAASLPIIKDTQIGRLEIVSDKQEIVRTVPLYALEDVKGTWWQWLFG